MKKVIYLTLSIMLAMLVFTGCSNNSEPYTQKNFTSDGTEISEINIDVRDRIIEVSPSSDDQIHIDYYENSKEYYDVSVSDAHVLTMTAASDKEWTDYIGGKSAASSRKISLQLPNTLLEALKVATTNGDISISALTPVGNLSLTSNGGNLVFEKLNVKDTIRLDAKNGNISGAIIGGYDDYAISCDIKKGKSNLPSNKENGQKTLDVANNNGDINIEFVSE